MGWLFEGEDGNDGVFDVWQTVLCDPFQGCWFFFEITYAQATPDDRIARIRCQPTMRTPHNPILRDHLHVAGMLTVVADSPSGR